MKEKGEKLNFLFTINWQINYCCILKNEFVLKYFIVKAENRRTDTFELGCWRRLLRVLWTAKRSNQSILKEISTEYSLEGLLLKLQYFGHLMWRTNSLKKKPWCWERLRARGERSDRGWDRWMASLTQWTWASANSGRWWRTGMPGVLQFMGLQRVRHDLVTELHSVKKSNQISQ